MSVTDPVTKADSKPDPGPDFGPDFEAQLPSADKREAALCAHLDRLGIDWTIHTHAPVFTVEEAKNLRGSLPGLHTKNLFLKDKSGGLWLVVAREELTLDLNALSKLLGSPRFSFGKPALMVETLGIAPGAVTPFALINDIDLRITAVFDKAMMEGDILNFHPLRNDKTMAIAAQDLLKFTEGTGHMPRLMTLPERPE
jgi:Ala-tRNA(Pro) deacylase